MNRKRLRLFILVFTIALMYTKMHEYLDKEAGKSNIVDIPKVHDNSNDTFLLYDKIELQEYYLGSPLTKESVDVIKSVCDSFEVDYEMILAVILTNSSGDVSHGRGLFNMNDVPTPYIINDIFVIELKRFLVSGGYYSQEDLNKYKYVQKIPFLKCYTNVYGDESLTPLYNNYRRITGKDFK